MENHFSTLHFEVAEIDKFCYYLNNCHPFPDAQIKYDFLKIHGDIIMELMNVILQVQQLPQPTNFSVKWYYSSRLLDQTQAFRDYYDEVYRAYISSMHNNLVKQVDESMDMELDLAEIKDEMVFEKSQLTVDFTPIGNTQPMTVYGVSPNKSRNPPHVVIDTLNFLKRMMYTINGNLDKLELMDLDRNVEKHQFDSIHDFTLVLNHTKKFLQQAIPSGGSAYFVVKRFGNVQTWNTFLSSFRQILEDANFPIKCQLLLALNPYNSHQGFDEPDDTLTVRYALLLSSRRYKVFVWTNDNYQSMGNNWYLDSPYLNLSVNKKSVIKSNHFDFRLANQLRYISFRFMIQSSELIAHFSEPVMA